MTPSGVFLLRLAVQTFHHNRASRAGVGAQAAPPTFVGIKQDVLLDSAVDLNCRTIAVKGVKMAALDTRPKKGASGLIANGLWRFPGRPKKEQGRLS